MPRGGKNGHVDPEPMDDPDLIHRILTSPAFDKAWEECKGTGIGTKENYDLMYERFREYDFVRDRINETAKEILLASEPLLRDDLTDEEIKEFHEDMLRQLIAVAIAHFITGIMTGATWYIQITDPEEQHA